MIDTKHGIFDIMYWPDMVERILRATSRKVFKDDLSRAIRITPFNGAYGVAGYAVLIEGTPPLAVLTLVTQAEQPLFVVYPSTKRCRMADEYSGSALLSSIRADLLLHIKTQEHKQYVG